MNGKRTGRIAHNTTRVLALGFAAVILLGALLLTLPAASVTGESVGFSDALFTSTSAVCVTGLVVRDTGTEYTLFGQIVIILLIQIGGLGLMTVATLFFMLLGKRITLGERLIIQESMNEDRIGGLVRLMRWVAFSAFTIELCGAAVLATRLIPDFGFARGLYYSIFHSISAFCNAGFDLFGNYSSLTAYVNDPVINFTIMLLIIIGGLGFGVLEDLWRNRGFRRLRLHSKIVLWATGIAIAFGTLFTLAVEWSNPATIGPLNGFQKVMASMFQSVTLRTAGFNSIDQAALHPATKLISIVLMFIGACPASTGGGIKLTTLAVLIFTVRMVARGRSEICVFKRTIPRSLVQQATTVVFIGIAVLLVDVVVLTLLEPGVDFLDNAFECASALGTVGVSSIGSANLLPLARYFIIFTMFIGRVGPLTLTLAIARRQANSKDVIRYPEDRVLVG